MKKRRAKPGDLIEIMTLDHATMDNDGWLGTGDKIDAPPVMKVVGYLVKQTARYYVLAAWRGVSGKGDTDFSTLLYVIKNPSTKIWIRR